MKSKSIFLVLAILLIAGGYFWITSGKKEVPKVATSTESRSEADKHSHGEHKDDPSEGSDHNHGDKDEHAHGDEHDKDHHDEAGGDKHDHSEEGGHTEESKISDSAVKNLNIEVLEVSSAMVQETISVSGRVTLNQNTTAQVKARFPGVIRSVVKEPGEAVAAGDTLATVESNESLQVYPVKSPISGTIINRAANVGELAGDSPLFVVANLSKLWAELFIFSKDGEKLKAGQKVRIQCLDDPVNTESTISLVLPTAEASSQTVVARTVIENADNHWRSGMNIRADIVLSEKEVPLAVKTEAIQRMEGNIVVFIAEEGGTFKAQPVETGISDSQWTEIKGGLTQGQRYVAKNSFVVKADIGKAGAEHEH